MYVCDETQEPLVEVGTQTPIGLGVSVVLVIILFVIVISLSRKKMGALIVWTTDDSDTVEDQDRRGSLAVKDQKKHRGKGYHKEFTKVAWVLSLYNGETFWFWCR